MAALRSDEVNSLASGKRIFLVSHFSSRPKNATVEYKTPAAGSENTSTSAVQSIGDAVDSSMVSLVTSPTTSFDPERLLHNR